MAQAWQFTTVLLISSIVGMALSPLLSGQAQSIPAEPVQPSMWWIIDRSPVGWIQSFTVDEINRKVNIRLVVPQWNQANYIQRFAFLRRLGQEAQKSGYGVLLENDRQETLGEYQISNGAWRYLPPNLGAFPFRRDTN
jgi:hypothetical protein